MTDEQTPTTTPEPGPLFLMAVTADAYMKLVTQIQDLQHDVEELQAATPADHDDDSVDGDEYGQVMDRIDRHRSEIENIKRVMNQIIRFLGTTQIPQTPAADPQTTTQFGGGA